MQMRSPLLKMAPWLLGACLALPAQAAPVRYDFAGTVQSDSADRGLKSFTGFFSFDRDATDAIADPSTAAYAGSGAPWSWSIAFDGQAAIGIDASVAVLVMNDLGGADRLGVLAEDGVQSFSLSLFDFTQALLSSDALPLPAGGLTQADFGWTWLSWNSGGDMLEGQLDALHCVQGCEAGGPPPPPPPPNSVPEPHGAALAALALLGLCVPARRRRTGRLPG